MAKNKKRSSGLVKNKKNNVVQEEKNKKHKSKKTEKQAELQSSIGHYMNK